MKIVYSNKDDPRVFVYRDENGPSGYGVTLNFAHRKAWAVLAANIIPLIPVVCVTIVKPAILRSSPELSISLLVAYCVCFAVLNVVVAFRGASRDLKRYPGPKGPRVEGDVIWCVHSRRRGFVWITRSDEPLDCQDSSADSPDGIKEEHS